MWWSACRRRRPSHGAAQKAHQQARKGTTYGQYAFHGLRFLIGAPYIHKTRQVVKQEGANNQVAAILAAGTVDLRRL